jgi:hypothetical protein
MQRKVVVQPNIFAYVSILTVLACANSFSAAQSYSGNIAQWELIEENYLNVEDVYYDERRFVADNSISDEQWYVWVLHAYDRKRGIEHYNDNFEVVYVDDINLHQSVVNLTIIECGARRYASVNSEYYEDAPPRGRPLVVENHENSLVTLPIMRGGPFDKLCRKYKM